MVCVLCSLRELFDFTCGFRLTFCPLGLIFFSSLSFLPVPIFFHSYSPQLNQFFILKFSTFYYKYRLLSPTIGHVPISIVVLLFTANVLAAKLEVDFGIFSRITLVDGFILMHQKRFEQDT